MYVADLYRRDIFDFEDDVKEKLYNSSAPKSRRNYLFSEGGKGFGAELSDYVYMILET